MADAPALPFVSVIVPVYNDAARLALCLAALEAQTYPPDRYEVIVVDNGSEIPITAAIGSFPHARFERELQPGCCHARITGITCARGEMFAFTDADCLPGPAWIARGAECFRQTPNCGLVGGRINVFPQDPTRPNVAEVLSVATHLKQDRFLRTGGWAAFANAFASRQVMERVGPMKSELMLNEEIEWGQRIRAAGYTCAYAAEAVVRHPARATIVQHCQRAMRHEFSWRQLRKTTGIGRGLQFWVGQHLFWPLRDACRDIICNRQLTAIQKTQATALAFLLMLLRLVAWFMMLVGVRYNVRKNWG